MGRLLVLVSVLLSCTEMYFWFKRGCVEWLVV